MPHSPVSSWKDKILFTPGPLTTSQTVKQSMLRDLGSRDHEFIRIVQEIRNHLVRLGGATPGTYEAILMQGSGTFSVEAVLASGTPRDGKYLVIINGAYGHRINTIATTLGIPTRTLVYPENRTPDLKEIEAVLQDDPAITNVAVVHCETTSGIMNPIDAIGTIAANTGKLYFVDAMSSFGAVPIDLAACQIDYLVSSANKCIEGVPGFGFILAKTSTLQATEGYARSVCLDLLGQWKGLEANGQFRFTPPTHSLIAFHQALQELEAEGGIEGRAERYRANYTTLVQGMRSLGFEEYVDPEQQGYIITSFYYPDHPAFSFQKFYDRLNDRDFVIYPGKVTNADCFRIGNIGRINSQDVQNLLHAINDTLQEMGIEPRPAHASH